MVIIKQEELYEIFTDASFDNKTKIATYGIVILQEKKTVKTLAKKCEIQLENSTECAVYAIYQAINIIESNLLNKKIIQKFWLRTDCVEAKEFFEKPKAKIFKQNIDLYNKIKEKYNIITNKMSQKSDGFTLKWIPRGSNKIAHKFSYKEFQRAKKKIYNENIFIFERKNFLQFLKRFNSKQCKVLIYLYIIANEEKIIVKTQEEVAKSIDMSYSTVNRIFKKLKTLNMLKKIENGKYQLL